MSGTEPQLDYHHQNMSSSSRDGLHIIAWLAQGVPLGPPNSQDFNKAIDYPKLTVRLKLLKKQLFNSLNTEILT